jgi:hypothetical protein
MGVEQVFLITFNVQKEYEATWKLYNASSKKTKAPRVDMEMQTS